MNTLHLFVILLLLGLCHGVSQIPACTEPGKFPNDENHDCRGLVICLIGGLSNFTQIKLSCPQGSIYNHLEQQCTNATNYKCYPNFNCTSVDSFPNPEFAECTSTSFVSCVMGLGEMATARLIECPVNTTFDPSLKNCVDKSQLTCTVPTVPPVVISSTTIVNQTTKTSHDTRHNSANNVMSKNAHYVILMFTVLISIYNLVFVNC